MAATLTGTEKQLAWAEQIRSAQMAALAKWNAGAAELIADEDAENQPELTAWVAKVSAAIERQTAAAWWIDHRDCPLDELMAHAAKVDRIDCVSWVQDVAQRQFKQERDRQGQAERAARA